MRRIRALGIIVCAFGSMSRHRVEPIDQEPVATLQHETAPLETPALEAVSIPKALGIELKSTQKPRGNYRMIGDYPLTPDNFGIEHDGIDLGPDEVVRP